MPIMAEERWTTIRSLFREALACDPAEREAFLRAACAHDPDLYHEVRSLLEADQAAGPVGAERPRRSAAPVAAPPLTAGRQIGPYTVVEEIGRGGMGRVYRARDPRLDRFVALKLLDPAFGVNESAQARFLAEARAVSSLDHPNICTVYAADVDADGRLYIAMTCYEGVTLDRRLADGPLPIDEAVRLVDQVAAGLAHAHRAGIVHRDVKPSNLMVVPGEDGGPDTVKILDFGIAKLDQTVPLTRSGERIGTVAYMAPEQIRNEPVDARADLWALGVVFYELLTGERPFAAPYDAAVLYAVLEHDPPPPSAFRPGLPLPLDALVGHLLEKDPARRVPDAPALRAELAALDDEDDAVPVPSARLPVPLTNLIGREADVDRALTLLEAARLLTLVGPGGTGKTRLGAEVARRAASAFPDGVVFVGLAPVSDPTLVVPAIGHELGLADASPVPLLERLIAALAGRRTLLVLDNFEQVVEAAPDLADVLTACPGVKALVTSRVALRIRGEQEMRVPPLAVPDPSADTGQGLETYPAVRLFVERARAVRPEFALTAETAPAVAALCTRLDGLPLAIELAAARIRLFSPTAMLARLEDRLDLLGGGARDLPERHQTLRQAISWSTDLLGPAERQVFHRLAVFVGGFTLEAAEAVCRTVAVDPLEAISSLVDHNLLLGAESADGEPRFTLLETIRTYGLEQLRAAGEFDAVSEEHARYFMMLAEAVEPRLTGPEQAVGFDRLEAEHANFRAALAWAEAHGEAEIGLRTAAALWRYWLARGYLVEGAQMLRRMHALDASDVAPAVRARLLNGLGTLTHELGDNRGARPYLEESLALWAEADDPRGRAVVLNNLAWVACELSDLPPARTLSAEALALCRGVGERRGEAVALNNLGWVAMYEGAFDEAWAYHAESLAVRRAIGDRSGVAFALANLAWAELMRGRPEEAWSRVLEARAIVDVVRHQVMLAWTMVVQGLIALGRERLDEAAAILMESLTIWRAVGHRSGEAWSLDAWGKARLLRGHPDQAREAFTGALSLWEELDCPWGLAMARHHLGELAEAEGDPDTARVHYAESLRTRQAIGDRHGAAESAAALERVQSG